MNDFIYMSIRHAFMTSYRTMRLIVFVRIYKQNKTLSNIYEENKFDLQIIITITDSQDRL